MKRGTKCVAQTINLSNPETCIRPKRIQKLVSADTMQPCPTMTGPASSYWTPKPVAIRICTRKDMQRTCPPKVCDCQPKKRRTFGQRFCTILLFFLKSSIAAGLVYWTRSEGLWGSSAEVEDLYRRIMATISPSNDFEDYCRAEREDIELPRFNQIKYKLIKKYNQAVFTVMNCILNASTALRNQLQRLMVPESDKSEEEEEDAAEDTKEKA
ncbi:uncharacterized protein LOC102678329 [Apis dorsata]|uniref:uncharacterized protein LOC102678329 n=1 Tax=Apis dorsata TaxID=7462 RepID=UPI0003DF529C|nr:uncharacterized protein LOC102678329 [Apis dorsata]